jgi:hypothetical protein
MFARKHKERCQKITVSEGADGSSFQGDRRIAVSGNNHKLKFELAHHPIYTFHLGIKVMHK